MNKRKSKRKGLRGQGQKKGQKKEVEGAQFGNSVSTNFCPVFYKQLIVNVFLATNLILFTKFKPKIGYFCLTLGGFKN